MFSHTMKITANRLKLLGYAVSTTCGFAVLKSASQKQKSNIPHYTVKDAECAVNALSSD